MPSIVVASEVPIDVAAVVVSSVAVSSVVCSVVDSEVVVGSESVESFVVSLSLPLVVSLLVGFVAVPSVGNPHEHEARTSNIT